MRRKECGCFITPETKNKVQKNGNKHCYIYYHFTQKKGAHNAEWIEEKELDKMFQKVFARLKIPKEELARLNQTLKEAHSGKIKYTKDSIDYHNREIAKIQNRIESAYEDKCDGSLSKEEFDDLRSKWHKQKGAHMVSLEKVQKADEEYYIAVSYLLEIAAKGDKLFKYASMGEKRELIGLIGQNLYFDGQNIDFIPYKPFDTLLNCNNDSMWLLGLDSNQ